MVKRIVFLALSILSLFAGMIFLANAQATVTGGFLGVAGTTTSALIGFVFIVLSVVFYFLTGRAKQAENNKL